MTGRSRTGWSITMASTITAPAVEARPWETEFSTAVEDWLARTGSRYAAAPTWVSPVPANTDIAAAVHGSKMLGLELTPQGCQVAAVLEAKNSFGRPLYDDVTGEIPRRATKTTTVQVVLLGRCELRPGYRVIQTAQDGTRASMVFMDMVRTLEQRFPDEEDRSWRVFKSTGREFIEWDNGSRWWVAPPRPSSFRGLAADVLWFDEAGELDPVESDNLEAGALPVMDTRPDGQVIKTGTPGLLRAGLFWKSLAAARETPGELGIIDYCAKDSEVVDIEGLTDEDVEALLQRVHPGVSCGLTTTKKIMKRYATMDPNQFIREYLCVWPADTSQTALDLEKFAGLEMDPQGIPEGTPWALGFNVAIGGVSAAVVAGWYTDEGHARIQVMEYRVKSDWLAEDLAKAIRTHPRVPVGYDNIGDNISIAQALQRKPRLNTRTLKSLQLREVAAATATISAGVDQETLRWATSPALVRAVEAATWRESGGSRLFRRIEGKDISTLLAAAHALGAAAGLKKRSAGKAGYAPVTE